jgi:hypothetical protein
MRKNSNTCYCTNQHLVVVEEVCDLCYGSVYSNHEPESKTIDFLGDLVDHWASTFVGNQLRAAL